MKRANRHLIFGAIFLLSSLLFGLVGYRVAGWGWIESAYMVVITIFGVGYGEVQKTTPGLKLFTMALIFAGCTAYIYITGAFINWLTAGQLKRVLGKRKMAQKIEHLKNHIIICGHGRIGSSVAKELHEAGKSFVIIENDPALASSIEEAGYLCVLGDATEESILLEAGLERAKVLTTVLPNDATNVFIVLTARNLKSDLTIIARGNQPSSEPKLRQAGANRVVLPEHICAERISHLIVKPTAREFLEYELNDAFFLESLSEIGLELEEIALGEDSPLIDATLEELETLEKGAFLVVAIRKRDGKIAPKPPLSTKLEAQDTLIVMSRSGVVPEFIRKKVRKQDMMYRGAKG